MDVKIARSSICSFWRCATANRQGARAVIAAGIAVILLPLWAMISAPPAAAASHLKTLYRFKNAGDLNPLPRPFLGPDGALYGTTTGGGSGAVYQLTPPTAPGAPWTETVLHTFVFNGVDGASPWGGVIRAPNGVLFGATIDGGNGSCAAGCGTVYQLVPPASPGGLWTESVIYNFLGGPGDGDEPMATLTRDDAGALYGTTLRGGDGANCSGGCGTVFKLTPPPGPHGLWKLTILHAFNSDDGGLPSGVLILDPDGALYGTTTEGGTTGFGTVFRLLPPATNKKPWKHTVLHNFKSSSNNDGSNPWAGVIFGADGALYGSTQLGGGDPNCAAAGCGTVFRLTPPAPGHTKWTEKILYVFMGGSTDGSLPMSDLLFDQDGALYGTTNWGGSANCDLGCGTVFKLIPPSPGHTKWKRKILHMFEGGHKGAGPHSGLVSGQNGTLYGTTFGGDDFGTKNGTAYQLTQ